MPLTLQVFNTAQLFLQAIGNASNVVDGASMNIVIGAAHDAIQSSESEQNGIWMILHGQQSGEIETIGVSHEPQLASTSFVWMSVCSHNLETYYIAEMDAGFRPSMSQVLDAVVHVLVNAKVPPVHSAFGPKYLVQAFLTKWSTHAEPTLTVLEKPFLETRLAYITLVEYNSISRESEGKGQYEILDLVNLDSSYMKTIHTQLVQCILEFWGSVNEGSAASADFMINSVLNKREMGRLWICRPIGIEKAIAGYLYAGRETKNTISIRNVYTREAFRGKGVARLLVAAACKQWLLDADEDKKKESVTLFVEPENVAATRAYTRSGFLIGDEPWQRTGFEGVSKGKF